MVVIFNLTQSGVSRDESLSDISWPMGMIRITITASLLGQEGLPAHCGQHHPLAGDLRLCESAERELSKALIHPLLHAPACGGDWLLLEPSALTSLQWWAVT